MGTFNWSASSVPAEKKYLKQLKVALRIVNINASLEESEGMPMKNNANKLWKADMQAIICENEHAPAGESKI